MAHLFAVLEELVEQARGPACGRYRVQWAVVDAAVVRRKGLLDAFLGTLKDAARDGGLFDPATGLPARIKPARCGPPRTAGALGRYPAPTTLKSWLTKTWCGQLTPM
jgi:hypothetical protein